MIQVFHLLPTQMTSPHPRRALAQSEADAWLDLHSDWSKGLPADVRDTSVIGEVSASGDGRSLPWYRFDGAFVGAPGPRGYEPLGLSGSECPRRITGDEPKRTSTYEGPIHGTATEPVDYAALDHERRIVHDLPADLLVQFSTPAMPLPTIDLQEFPDTSRRAVRARAAEDTRQFSAVTSVTDQRVPSRLTYDQHSVDSRRYRTAAYADLSGHLDHSCPDQLAYDELVAWLRIEAGCTHREVEALERRAAGQPVPDRHCLIRAQRRAQAALA
jgi:hypothetical protein